MRLVARLLFSTVLVAVLTTAAQGGEERPWAAPPLLPADNPCVPAAEPAPEAPCWKDGTCSLEFLTGFYPKAHVGPPSTGFGESSAGRGKIEYVPLSLRLGYELPKLWFPDTCIQGKFEALFEYDTFVITGEFGSYFTGPSVLLRYSWIQPQWLLVPYIQGGTGIVFTDAYRTPVQHLIGRWQEFLLQLAAGVRVRLTEQWSLNVEGGFQHISNAGLADRNGGINNVGFVLGLTYTFGPR
jgi:hypothetical protein